MKTPVETILTTAYRDGMMQFVQDNPSCFSELIQLSLGDRYPYNWRAAWLLGKCMKENDVRLQPHVQDILNTIHGKKDGHQRDLLRLLFKMKLDENTEGQFFDTCVSLWEQLSKIPSLRALAFQGLLEITRKYPEIKEEVKLLTQEHYLQDLSPGIKRSIIGRLKEL